MARAPWRFQCDVPYGETDPMVTVFVGEVLTRGDGSKFVEQDVNHPVQMKLSEVDDVLMLADPSVMGKKQEALIAESEENLRQSEENQKKNADDVKKATRVTTKRKK